MKAKVIRYEGVEASSLTVNIFITDVDGNHYDHELKSDAMIPEAVWDEIDDFVEQNYEVIEEHD